MSKSCRGTNRGNFLRMSVKKTSRSVRRGRLLGADFGRDTAIRVEVCDEDEGCDVFRAI